MKFDENKLELLINDSHGTYIPQIFFEMFEDQIKDFFDADKFKYFKEVLLDPENELYWDAWNDLEMYSDFTLKNDDGVRYTIALNGDLWAWPEDMDIPEDFFA